MTDWKTGDLAECMADGWSCGWVYNPKRSDILRVKTVGLFEGEMALGFEGKPLRQGWNAVAFRKIEQDHTPCEMRFDFEMQGVCFAVKNRKTRA